MYRPQGCRGDRISIPIPIQYPQKNLWENPRNSHTHRTPKSSILISHTLRLFVRCIFYCYYVYSVMIIQEKFKNAIETNSKLDSIRRNSNIDYDIYRTSNAFPLNLTSIQKSPQNSHRPMGIHHSPHIHPIPISMVIPIHTHGSPVYIIRTTTNRISC